MNVLSDEFFDTLIANIGNGKIYNFNYSNPVSTQIEKLFDSINKYARSNYLFNTKEYGNKYIIRYNDYFFEVGVLYGEDPVYYISLVESKDVLSYFDIHDVRNNTIRGKENIVVSEYMKNITLEIKELLKMGVPVEPIEDEIKLTLMQNKKPII